MGTLLSLAHFFITLMMYSTCGFPVFRRIWRTSLNVSLVNKKQRKEKLTRNEYELSAEKLNSFYVNFDSEDEVLTI